MARPKLGCGTKERRRNSFENVVKCKYLGMTEVKLSLLKKL
jgi:hypothetical protein